MTGLFSKKGIPGDYRIRSPRYGNPFKTTETQKKMSNLAKWEFLAGKIKSSTNTPTSVKEIAAELYAAEERSLLK